MAAFGVLPALIGRWINVTKSNTENCVDFVGLDAAATGCSYAACCLWPARISNAGGRHMERLGQQALETALLALPPSVGRGDFNLELALPSRPDDRLAKAEVGNDLNMDNGARGNRFDLKGHESAPSRESSDRLCGWVMRKLKSLGLVAHENLKRRRGGTSDLCADQAILTNLNDLLRSRHDSPDVGGVSRFTTARKPAPCLTIIETLMCEASKAGATLSVRDAPGWEGGVWVGAPW